MSEANGGWEGRSVDLFILAARLGVTSQGRWLRRPDSNWRPPGYEPDELPDCSTPHQSKKRPALQDYASSATRAGYESTGRPPIKLGSYTPAGW